MNPVIINLPNCNHLYNPSNKIHMWYTLECAIASGQAKIKMLQAEIEAEQSAVKNRQKQIHSLRMDVISSTDPVQQYLDNKNGNG